MRVGASDTMMKAMTAMNGIDERESA